MNTKHSDQVYKTDRAESKPQLKELGHSSHQSKETDDDGTLGNRSGQGSSQLSSRVVRSR